MVSPQKSRGERKVRGEDQRRGRCVARSDDKLARKSTQVKKKEGYTLRILERGRSSPERKRRKKERGGGWGPDMEKEVKSGNLGSRGPPSAATAQGE